MMINGNKFKQGGMETFDGGPVAVILAAGRGSRMGSEQPKAAIPLAGKPLLLHVVDNLAQAGFRQQVIVVGYRHTEVQALLNYSNGVKYQFVRQEQQKGTAHAFLCTEKVLAHYHGPLLVTCGDMPFISSASFASLLQQHREGRYAMSLLSTELKDAAGYGRIVRNARGELTSIVEEKDASAEQRKIGEVNMAAYVFSAPRIFRILQQIQASNSQSEYYLPDTVALYCSSGERVESFLLANSWEAYGINSFAELEMAEKLFHSKRAELLMAADRMMVSTYKSG